MRERTNTQPKGWAGQWGRHRWPMPARRKRRSSFLGQIVGAAAIAAVIGWTQAPLLNAAWAQLNVSPEEIARVEQSVYYSGCSEARAAGAAPLYRGTPGYREGMDGDRDGVACEPYR
jgi:Excalibur calcium-binding domain